MGQKPKGAHRAQTQILLLLLQKTQHLGGADLRRQPQLVATDNSETGRIRFRGVRFQTPNSVSFFGLTEFRGANSVSSFRPIICVQTRHSPSFSQNSPSVPQNSVSSLLRNSTLETVFGPLPNNPQRTADCRLPPLKFSLKRSRATCWPRQGDDAMTPVPNSPVAWCSGLLTFLATFQGDPQPSSRCSGIMSDACSLLCQQHCCMMVVWW